MLEEPSARDVEGQIFIWTLTLFPLSVGFSLVLFSSLHSFPAILSLDDESPKKLKPHKHTDLQVAGEN